jgi:hypothetical protein
MWLRIIGLQVRALPGASCSTSDNFAINSEVTIHQIRPFCCRNSALIHLNNSFSVGGLYSLGLPLGELFRLCLQGGIRPKFMIRLNNKPRSKALPTRLRISIGRRPSRSGNLACVEDNAHDSRYFPGLSVAPGTRKFLRQRKFIQGNATV